jgi:hypothetical protein
MLIQLSRTQLIDDPYDYKGLAILVVTLALIVSTTCALFWSSLIRKQLLAIRNSTLFRYRTSRSKQSTSNNDDSSTKNDPFRMIRCINNECIDHSTCDSSLNSKILARRINMLSLNPDFVKQHEHNDECSTHQWKLMSLGGYVSSLRPYLAVTKQMDDHPNLLMIPQWLESEIQAALAMALLGALGPRIGTVILPTLGLHVIRETVRKIVATLSTYLPGNNTRSTLDDETDPMDIFADLFDNDRGGIPVSISTMSTAAELNYQRGKKKRGRKDASIQNPLDLLRMGEVGYDISFGHDDALPNQKPTETERDKYNCIISNPFILSEHWCAAIQRMEQLMKQKDISYDPISFSMRPAPRPIDDRWFPDLYIGWGNALCTHNQRQILQNRLMATLLNRLANNYRWDNNFQQSNGQTRIKPFIVKMSPAMNFEITRPCDLIASLIESGHEVETCVQTQPTTFGVSLCVKNSDANNDWTNIPLAYFLENGLSDIDGNESYVCLPHSGLNLDISGGRFCDNVNIQHYMAVEGLCGWHSNHYANVPWIQAIVCENSVRRGHDALDSVRIAGLQAIIFNTVGTRYELPFGGYGLTGVCNDTAAQIESAISKNGMTTHIYPLTFHGKFAMYSLRVAYELRCTFVASRTNNHCDLESLDRLIRAILTLPSDTNSAPITDTISQCYRYLHSHSSNPPFQLLVQSRQIIESIRNELMQIQSAIVK